MNTFSISQLEQFSGIKSHTIRVWEQRYDALTPTRSKGNTRYYDNTQLRRLLNIVSLMESGFKISELCAMPDNRLFNLLEAELQNTLIKENTNEYFISQLIVASTTFDEVHFEKIFSNCLLRMGMRNTYTQVIYPLLKRMGLMWTTNTISPAYEHFCANLISQKLLSAIDALPPAKASQSSWLLFLPENEFHEIGLLFSYYIIRQAGNKVIYLGNSLPFDTLRSAVEETNPDHLFFFLVHQDRTKDSQEYLNMLKMNFTKQQIHLSGNEKLIKQLKTGNTIHWIKTVADLENQLEQTKD